MTLYNTHGRNVSTFVQLQAIFSWLFVDRTALRYLHFKGGKEAWRNVKIQSRTWPKQVKTRNNLFFKGVEKLSLAVYAWQAMSQLVHRCVNIRYFAMWFIQSDFRVRNISLIILITLFSVISFECFVMWSCFCTDTTFFMKNCNYIIRYY